jgi:Sulfotransferase domain.
MLDGHPDVCFHHEFVYSVDKIKACGEVPDINSYLEYLSSDRVFQLDDLKIKQSNNYVEIVRDFLTQIKGKTKKTIVGATVHRNIRHLPKIWPSCKFIHIVRDPRDVTRSYVNMGWGGHVWVAADAVLKLEQEWDDFVQTLSEGRFITIKYEDLVADPEKVLSRLCDFIGVSYHNDMLKYSENSTYSKPDASLSHQWKRKATKYEVSLVEYKLRNMMLKYNYELSGYERPNVSFITSMVLNIIGRKNRFLFSVRKYGVCLKVLDVLSRRLLPVSSFRGKVQNKMNEISNLKIK